MAGWGVVLVVEMGRSFSAHRQEQSVRADGRAASVKQWAPHPQSNINLIFEMFSTVKRSPASH